MGLIEEDVPNLEVFGFVFGSKPESPAFGPGGELEVETGRFAKSAYEPCGAEMTYPFDDEVFTLKREGFADFFRDKKRGSNGWLWRNLHVHYTPRSRRADALEIWDYFVCKHGDLKESFVLARKDEIAKAAMAKYPEIDASTRYQRLASQYLVKTRLEYRPLRAVGKAEAESAV